jgi:hypothetical protein
MAGGRTRRFAAGGLVLALACIGASRIPSLASDSAAVPAAAVKPAADAPLCYAGQQCVAVDGAVGLGTANRKAIGFLHGFGAATSPARIAALRPTSWRASGGQGMQTQIHLYAGTTTEILSDYWIRATYDARRGGGRLPWEDWNAYSNFITDFVRKAKQQGWAPTYWEIQNEPDSWLGYAPPVHANIAQILQTFQVGYAAVKRADPAAKVIGPSLSGFLVSHNPARPELLDMTTFLDFSGREGLHWDAIAWHETEPDYMPVAERRPEAIPGHVAKMRQMLQARPQLGHPLIFVNEYMYPENIDVPGWRVGYMAALEQANVDIASMSCPLSTPGDKGCFEPSLDRLLENDGNTPRPGYWVVLSYANMLGQRVATWSSDPHLSAFATRISTSGGPVQVLLGRHVSCTTAVNPQCHDPLSATPPPVNLTVAVRVGGSNRSAVVTIEHFPDANRSMQTPEAPKFVTVPVVNGVARVPVNNFTDGEAYALTVA